MFVLRDRGEREGADEDEAVAVLRSVRRMHPVHPAPMPLHGHGGVVPPCMQVVRSIPAQLRPATVSVHGRDHQLLQPQV